MLFEVKIARFSVVFIDSNNCFVDYQPLTKTSKTHVFLTNRLFFQNDAYILASFLPNYLTIHIVGDDDVVIAYPRAGFY